LVCLVIYGNPVDAYKYFEFNYQQEYMPHRYLHDHYVLDIPKPAGYTQPHPKAIEPEISEPETSYSHSRIRRRFIPHTGVRYRMARAKDQGVGKSLCCFE
jgi:hypothetical protein